MPMTVAKWEYWSLATMMIAAYGEDAPAAVKLRLAAAEVDDNEADLIVWAEVARRLPEVMDEQARAKDAKG
jgi:hypothetical protein